MRTFELLGHDLQALVTISVLVALNILTNAWFCHPQMLVISCSWPVVDQACVTLYLSDCRTNLC